MVPPSSDNFSPSFVATADPKDDKILAIEMCD
jgi:hypothetical protein